MEVKNVGTFPVILLKLASPPLPPKTKLNLERNGWKWVLFLATTLLGEVGGRQDEPKAEQKIVLRSRVLRNNCLEGLFTQSQVLLSSIVYNWFRALKWIFRHLSLQKYRKTFSLELLKCSFLVKCFLYAAADPSDPSKELRIPCQTGVFGVDVQKGTKWLFERRVLDWALKGI